jgi:hypothetical protein
MIKIMMLWEPVCQKTKLQWHCVPRTCSSALSIYSSPQISERSAMRGRSIQMVNVTHSAGPAGFHTSQLGLTTGYKVSDKNGFFCTIILRLGKTVFSLPGDTLNMCALKHIFKNCFCVWHYMGPTMACCSEDCLFHTLVCTLFSNLLYNMCKFRHTDATQAF